MERGWIKLWRKSMESDAFIHDGLWKLWCLCLMKANHKPQRAPIESVVEPVLIRSGQFITGRYQLHGDYHGWSKRHKKEKPAPSTVWRWLQTLEKMQNLRIRSFNKYSIITINNWNQYQGFDQQMTNRRPADDHKQECIKNDKEGRAYQPFKENL